MKIVASIILVMLVMVVGLSRPRNRVDQATSVAQDPRDIEPLRGSEPGKMLAQACGNCHSNQTEWPWYSHVAPVSWWIQSHVREGREELNFSEWTRYTALERHNELESICGVVSNGRMPPASYRVLHPESRLEAEDKKLICAWAANEWEREK